MKQREKQKHITEETESREKKKLNTPAIAAICILCSAAIGVGAGFALTKAKHSNANGVNVVLNSKDKTADTSPEEKSADNTEETAQPAEEEKSAEQSDVKFPQPSEENDLINIIAEAKSIPASIASDTINVNIHVLNIFILFSFFIPFSPI